AGKPRLPGHKTRITFSSFPIALVDKPVAPASPSRSYLICATPRSGSTLLCEALKAGGIAGIPEEYFEALRHSGRPRSPQEYFVGAQDRTILRHLGEHMRV